MCLALPARIVALNGAFQAVVDLAGVRKAVSIELVPDAQVGEYVIVHVGHAIGRLDTAEAERTLARFDEVAVPEGLTAEPNA